MTTRPPALLLAAATLAALPSLASLASAQSTRPALPALPEIPTTTEQMRGEDYRAADVTVVAHVLEPRKLDATPDRIAALKVPDGLAVGVFARDLKRPRMIAVARDGAVYVSSRDAGTLTMLRDDDADGKADDADGTADDGDGTADGPGVTVAQKPDLHGVALSPDQSKLYFTTIKEVYVAARRPDGTLGTPTLLIDDLPDGGQHPNRTLAFGPDGMLYVSCGSTANATVETSPLSASIVQVDPETLTRTIFADGLRNTIGFGWHPATGELFGADHGIDWLGDDEEREEFNHIEQGHHYGWPYVYEDGKYNPQDNPKPPMTMAKWAAGSTPPVLTYTAHSAPLQMAFYAPAEGASNALPAEYRGDAFVAMRGSWNRKPPSGYEVVRVRFDDAGTPVKMEPFLTGFLVEQDGEGQDGEWRDGEGQGGEGRGGGYAQFARLAGLAVMNDGSLLVGDDENGVLYRVHPDAATRQASAE